MLMAGDSTCFGCVKDAPRTHTHIRTRTLCHLQCPKYIQNWARTQINVPKKAIISIYICESVAHCISNERGNYAQAKERQVKLSQEKTRQMQRAPLD